MHYSIEILLFTKDSFSITKKCHWMGNNHSTEITSQDFILILQNDNCIPSHQVWKQISIDDLDDFQIEQTSIDDLYKIKNERPSNFIELVATTVLSFSQVTEKYVTGTPNFLALHRFLWFMRLLLGVHEDDNKMQPWFRPNASYTESFIPYALFFQSAFTIITVPTNLHSSHDVSLTKLDTIETLIFFMYAPYVSGGNIKEPTKYMKCFESFVPSEYLNVLLSGRIKSSITEALCILAAPCIVYCTSWKEAISRIDMKKVVNFILENIDLYPHSIILFFTALFTTNESFNLDQSSKLKILEKLLLILHELSVKKENHFIQQVILTLTFSLIDGLDLYESCTLLHASKLVDFVIEAITDPFMYNFNATQKIQLIIVSILSSMEPKIANVSDFIASRLVLIFERFVDSESLNLPAFFFYKKFFEEIKKKNKRIAVFIEDKDNINDLLNAENEAPLAFLFTKETCFNFLDQNIASWLKELAKETFPQDFNKFISYNSSIRK